VMINKEFIGCQILLMDKNNQDLLK